MIQKISYIESKYFTVSGYNKFMNNIINNKTKEMQLVKEFWDSQVTLIQIRRQQQQQQKQN